MLLPRFTIRHLLLLMVVVALVALLVTFALRDAAQGEDDRGGMWTVGLAVGVGSLVVSAVVYALFYLLVLGLLRLVPESRKQSKMVPATQPRPPVPEAQP